MTAFHPCRLYWAKLAMETEFKRLGVLLKNIFKISSYLFNTFYGLIVQQNCTIKGKWTELSTAIGWKVNRKFIGANLTLSTAGKQSVCTTQCLYDFVPCLSLGSVFCQWICVQWYPRLPGHKVGYSSMFLTKWKLRNWFVHCYRKKNIKSAINRK